MKGLINGFKWLISAIKEIWEFVGNALNGLVLAFKALAITIKTATTTILNLPDWLQAFGIITITICGIYFVIGRSAGKSDK